DRLGCSWGRSLLPGEVPLPLLDAFQTAPPALGGRGVVPPAGEGAMAVRGSSSGPPDWGQGDVGHEIAHLERRSRRNRRRTWSLGIMTGIMAALGGMAAGGGAAEPTTFFFVMSGLSGAGALVSSQ